MVDAWTAVCEHWYHGLMKKSLVVLVLGGLLLTGCGPKSDESQPSTTPPAPEGGSVVPQSGGSSTPTGQSTPTNNGGEVQVLTGGAGAGGATPVVGGENLQGGGSGVGMAAKDSARNAATKVQGSEPQQSDDDNQVVDQ